MINHNNVVKSITILRLFSPSSILTENSRYLFYKYKSSHLDLYTDICKIFSKIKLSVTADLITNTVKELVEVRDSGCYSYI